MDVMNVSGFVSYFVASVVTRFFAQNALTPTIGASIFILLIGGVLLLVAILDWNDFREHRERAIRSGASLEGDVALGLDSEREMGK
jgi:hypothetical protein